MSADIIDLASRRPEDHVWRCDCGTVSFLLYQDGRVQCCGCDAIQHTRNARWVIPEPQDADVTAFPNKPSFDTEF